MWRRAIAVLVVAGLLMSGCGDDREVLAACQPQHDDQVSVPRLWIEQNLGAIRRDFPDPAVHARNLWHVSAAMWDAHALATAGAEPWLDHDVEVPELDELDESIAISHAAYRVLQARYELAVGGEQSLVEFEVALNRLCLTDDARGLGPGFEDPAAEAAVALGRAVADRVLEYGLDDGANEGDGYADPTYEPVNQPLFVPGDEIEMVDPNRWQPLELALRITQNGQVEDDNVQRFIGSHWGWVESFALPEADDRGLTIPVVEPPRLGTASEQQYIDEAVAVIAYSDLLGGPKGDEVIDIGPGARGNAVEGATYGDGHDGNPITGEPYEPNMARHGDYGRAVAEYWADGPDSETPPGHWNRLAIDVSDRLPADALRWADAGPVLDRHTWDLRLFFTLNAGLHDTAIAVWGAKRAFDFPRPISMIRHLGAIGALPEREGLVEVVTASSIESGRHSERFSPGTVVVRSWMGPVMDPESQLAGVDWRPVYEWLPYQRPTFVSPAFAAYVSGHSGFSRVAADLLTSATGSPFFPGGLQTHWIPANTFLHEVGPSVDIELQWATYHDAAAEAGESRRYGGIHIPADDLVGRRVGAEVAELVWAAAQAYFPA